MNWRSIGDAPGLDGPPDPEPSILDDVTLVEELLSDKDIPDYLATILADLIVRDFSEPAMMDAARELRRHLMPFIEEADKEAAERRRAGPDIEPDGLDD